MSEIGKLKYTSGYNKGWWVKIWLNQLQIATMQGVCQDEAEALAKEFVRRWNAFEDGGIVSELVEACEIGLGKALGISEVAKELGSKIMPIHKRQIEIIKAAIAKATPE